MAEEKKMTKKGLGGNKIPKPDPESEVPVVTGIKTDATIKPLGKKPEPRIVPIILVAILSFGAVGAVVWKILHDNQEKLAEVAAQSAKLRGNVDEITKEIAKTKTVESLNSLKLKTNDAIKGLETLKEAAKSIGDEATAKNADLDLVKLKPVLAQISILADRESKTKSAINDIEKSVQPFKDTEKLNCDQLLDAPKQFDEAVKKLNNPKNIPLESFANAEARKLVTDYINFKQKASNLYTKKSCGVPIPPPPEPINPEPAPINPEPAPAPYVPEPAPYVPPKTVTPPSDGVPICPRGILLKDC